MRMVTINGLTAPITGDQFSDEEVAIKVRMLYRDQIDHEAVCTIGRDRIMHLAQTNAVLLEALEPLAMAARMQAEEARVNAKVQEGPVREATLARAARWQTFHDDAASAIAQAEAK